MEASKVGGSFRLALGLFVEFGSVMAQDFRRLNESMDPRIGIKPENLGSFYGNSAINRQFEPIESFTSTVPNPRCGALNSSRSTV